MRYRKHKKIDIPGPRINYIYALCCPKSGAVKYVGWTSQDPTRRLEMHLSQARGGNPKPVYDWLRGLRPEKPILIVLEVLPPGTTLVDSGSGYVRPETQAEKKWIAKFSDSVLNVAK